MSDPEPTITPGEPGLGDAGKAAIAAERKRANDAEKSVKDLEARLKTIEDQGLSDLDKVRAELETVKADNVRLATESSTKDLAITRLTVGIEEGLPANLIARLQGTDEETFKTDAASLKNLVPDAKPDPFPKADPSQGPKGTPGNTSTAQQFADVISESLS